jgi:hypothetical protein
VPVEIIPRHQSLDDLDHLVHPRASGCPVLGAGLEVLDPRTEPDAQHESLAGEDRQRAHLLRHQDGITDRKLEHARMKTDPPGHHRHRREELKGIDEGGAIEE